MWRLRLNNNKGRRSAANGGVNNMAKTNPLTVGSYAMYDEKDPVKVKVMRRVNGSTVMARVVTNRHRKYRHGAWISIPAAKLDAVAS